jgi:hypothetical protein
MGTRLELQSILEAILGSNHVYFQPPESLKLTYPCIVYKLDDINTTFADNRPYSQNRRYSVTLIDKNPDSPIVEKLASVPKCSFNRAFPADNLNHYTFNLHY